MKGKALIKMSLEEKLDWAMGKIVIAIGRGDLRSEVAGIIIAIMQESYQRGAESSNK